MRVVWRTPTPCMRMLYTLQQSQWSSEELFKIFLRTCSLCLVKHIDLFPVHVYAI